MMTIYIYYPWAPKTFISRRYDPYLGGLKPSFFMVLGSKGYIYIYIYNSFHEYVGHLGGLVAFRFVDWIFNGIYFRGFANRKRTYD